MEPDGTVRTARQNSPKRGIPGRLRDSDSGENKFQDKKRTPMDYSRKDKDEITFPSTPASQASTFLIYPITFL
jgi:hypothetical protein